MMTKRPVAKITGQDYNFTEPDGSNRDIDLGPGGLVVEKGEGHAAENDPTR
jgi:hypothetical protein